MTTNETDLTESAPAVEDDAVAASAEDDTVAEHGPVDTEPSAVESSGITAPPDAKPGVDEPFLADAVGYQDRWNEIQTGFVDEPVRAVHHAGELLTELMDDLKRTLTNELAANGGRGDAGDHASTEDLRVAFQRYRSYFDRLVAV